MPFADKEYSVMGRWTVLRSRLHLILLGTLTAALGALIISLMLPKVFSAQVLLLVSESRITEPDTKISNFVYYELLRTYETFIYNDFLIQKVIENFGLQKPPYHLNVDQFKRRDILQVALQKNTRLLEITVEFPDAHLAADIATFFGASAVTFNEDMNTRDNQRALVFFREQAARASQELESANRRLTEFRKSSRLEEMRESVRILMEETSKNEVRLNQLKLDVPFNLAKREGLWTELNAQKPRIELKRGLDYSALLRERSNSSDADKARLPQLATLKEEAINPIYQELQSQILEADSEILGIKAEMNTLERTLGTNRPKVARLLQEKTVSEGTYDRLSREYTLAADNYGTLHRKYQEASLNLSSRTIELKQIAPAFLPERPIRPRIPLNVMLGAAFGLLASVLMSFFLHSLEATKRRVRLGDEIQSERKSP